MTLIPANSKQISKYLLLLLMGGIVVMLYLIGIKPSGFSILGLGYNLSNNKQTNNKQNGTDVKQTINSPQSIRKVMPLETEKPISLLPDKIYGYIVGYQIAAAINYPQLNDLQFNKGSISDSEDRMFFKVEKISEKEINVIGYISDETLAKIGDKNNLKNSEIIFLPKSYGDFKNRVAIPLQNIIYINSRFINFDEKNYFQILDIKTDTILQY